MLNARMLAANFHRMLTDAYKCYRICAKLRSEGHLQGKFSICESGIRVRETIMMNIFLAISS